MGALPNYYFSLFSAPEKVIKSLDSIRRDFVWGRKEGSHKIRWIAWSKRTKSKKHGGLGIGDLSSANLALLAKWWWKYKVDSSSLWVRVIGAIHENKRFVSFVPVNRKYTGMWNDIVSIGKEFDVLGIPLKEFFIAKVGSGVKVWFWTNHWADVGIMMDRFPAIFKIASFKTFEKRVLAK
ncbi:hypothetical protein HanRHA438_Chr10g0446711 [Helianthus annuus]|nr:hypothetical protein HanIR_Chr10g0468521 [Helianthus annuus]KAJ0879034.1 hypothetical protein HanRHA438_Chr10g0446711 [Helianthus annuus]